MPSRRSVLAGLATTLVPVPSWAAIGNPVAVSAVKLPDGRYGLVGISKTGDLSFQVPLPARGHAAAAHPTSAEIVAIARRPGTFAKVIDCGSGAVRQTLNAPEGRHFYGHGAFSQDGTLLFTTENDMATGKGRIGVWDRNQGYARVHEFSSHGIGPHEILCRPDGTLAIANGGIRTHPRTGREKLNLATMRPNLSIVSYAGELLDQAQVAAERHLNSLRHIAVQSDGCVACGFQWQGDPFEAPPLVALFSGDGTLRDVSMDDTLLRRLDGYIGSVGAHGADGFIASSPRGGRVFVIASDAKVGAIHSAADVCGVAPTLQGDSLITDGGGHVYQSVGGAFGLLKRHGFAFDNHLVQIKPRAYSGSRFN